ncbi:phage tail tip lysozyme [Kribbella sp. NPDC051952]|uniref:phage tail tip lysozyme n=1 Tax=Kribbella sp. NPDC051952 TaxID=3154851 RepID=UPI00342F2118
MTGSLAPELDHQRGASTRGHLVVEHLPLLASHHGTPPDVLLRWSAMPAGTTTVDVVVHLHGHSPKGRSMQLVRDMAPVSGLDLVDPAHPSTAGRTTPTLMILPRGHFYGGRSGRGYSFPALQPPGAITKLVDEALRRFGKATGVHARRGRLILTAHSGGGSALMAILRHLDPDEVHTFDALYSDPGPLITWARRRQAAGSGALRVLFRPGEATARNSLRVATALGRTSAKFRVEQTGVTHMAIPQTYGWRLLADPGADLPGATRPRQPDRSEHETPSGSNNSALCAAIARVAREQFRRWRPGGGRALTETSPAASPILREYYRVGVHDTVTDAQMQSSTYQGSHPWSAVFISYVMRTAGATGFNYSSAHRAYIAAARKNRLDGNTSNPFWAYRATEIAPQVGDLVCASRESGVTYDNIGNGRPWKTHCDVVTEVRPGQIRVIGGNVSQTVGEKLLRTRPDGKLDLSGNQSRFFAVIRCRSARSAPDTKPTYGPPAPRTYGPPAPRTYGPPASGSTPVGLDARVARVMELLVRKYGYPVNGAAGLVGNLMSESQVQPDRIEGSKSETPLRAPDFSGQLRDFTPDQVRDRNFSRKIGPRLPGVGLAQWTSPERRVGLFKHTFNGRQLGSAILHNLDAQVDYLVAELRGTYRAVDTVLRSPGVTLDQASDVVVLKFERPAAVNDKPTSDPGVQAVLTKRRAAGAQALRTFRSSSQR